MAIYRIDKFLWEVRLFKTRSLVADACKHNRILLNGVAVKPSHGISVGDTFQLKKGPVLFSFGVMDIPKSRVGAKLVPQYIENKTTRDQLELLELTNLNNGYRQKGLGRPTKKDRRDMSEFAEEYCFFDELDLEED